MTFKDLQKLVHSQSGPEQNQLLQRLGDKPFWIWDAKQHTTKQVDIKTKGIAALIIHRLTTKRRDREINL